MVRVLTQRLELVIIPTEALHCFRQVGNEITNAQCLHTKDDTEYLALKKKALTRQKEILYFPFSTVI